MKNLKEKFREKEGIAFIITLGLLAVLMVIGVSFAVYMKVEREAAANFALVGSCRQLALAGVAYAMDDISFSLEDKNDDNNDGLDFYWYPVLTDTWNSGDKFHGWYKKTADFGANFTGDSRAQSDYDRLANRLYNNNKLAKELIPPKTFETAKKLYSIGRIDTVDIFDDGEFPDEATAGRFNGNTSYIVVNLSGVLDPNFAGGAPRGVGGTPAQFDLGELPGINSEATFLSDRNTMGWYESMAEISRAPGVTRADLKCLYPFSMFASIPPDPSSIIKTNAADFNANDIRAISTILQDSLKSALTPPLDNQYANPNRYVAVLNLLDYLDDNNKPGGIPTIEDHPTRSYQNPCVEPFPMINEIYVSTRFQGRKLANDHYRNRMDIEFDVELWYPFVAPTCLEAFPGGLDLEYTLTFENENSNELDLMPEPLASAAGAVVNKPARTITETVPLNPAVFADNPFWHFSTTKKFRAYDIMATNTPAGDYDMTISVDVKIKERNGTYTFDGFVDNMMKLDVPLPLTGINDMPPNPNLEKTFDWQVIDPRLNYKIEWWTEMPDRADMYDNFGVINTVATDKMAEDETDSHWAMYVKGYEGNPGYLESIGEFGYLFIGDYWKTINLCDKPNAPRNKIYEYFSLEGNATNSGCANINSEYAEVLKAALKDMPIVPDGSVILTPAQLDNLVAEIQSLTADGGISPTNLFDSATQTAIFEALGVQNGTDFEKEAFYISGYPALRSDQQLFAIFSMGHYYASKQICMAIVWRDPVPDEDGRHPCFIRELIWLHGE